MLALIEKVPWLRTVKARLSHSPIAYRLARGAFWSLVGGITSRALTMVSSIIVARLLGKEGFGEMGMVQSTMGMLGVFAGFGLGGTATKYIAEHRIEDPTRAGRITNLTLVISMLTAGIMALACFGFSGWLAANTLNRANMAPLLAAGSLLLFISTLGSVLTAALAGFESFRVIALINVIQSIVALLLTIPLVWLFGIQGAIASMTVNAAIGLLLSAKALHKEYSALNISSTYDRVVWSEWPVLWRFSLPSLIAGALFIPASWICNAIIVNQRDGYSVLGLFGVASQWQTAIMFLPSLLTSALLPIFSETHGREDQTDFRKTFSLNLRLTCVIALPLTVMIIVLSQPIAALYGEQFHGAAPIIRILMGACFLNIINSIIGIALVGAGKTWVGAMMNFGWACILVTAAVLLVPRYGGMGLALAYLLAYIAHTIWQTVYLKLKLAPSVIGEQKRLAFFAAVLLLCAMMSSTFSGKYAFLPALLAVAAFFPLAALLKRATLFNRGRETGSSS